MEQISPSISHGRETDAGERREAKLATQPLKEPILSFTDLVTMVMSPLWDLREEKCLGRRQRGFRNGQASSLPSVVIG